MNTKLKRQIFYSFLLSIGLFGMILAPMNNVTTPSSGADGSTGAIYINDTYYGYTTMPVELEGLTGGADYALNITAGAYPDDDANNQVTFTTGSDETEKTIYLDDMRSPTTGSITTIILVYQSAGTEISRDSSTYRDVGTGLNISLILLVAIPVIIFLVVVKMSKNMQVA